MAKFRHAWCKEEKKLMDTDDVIDFILQHDRKPEFMCPDADCRKQMPDTRLYSVCCDPRKATCDSIPHFSTFPNHLHSESCPYQALAEHTESILRHRSEFRDEFPEANLLKSIDGIDSELLPDAFVEEYSPKEFIEEIKKKAKEYESRHISHADAFRRARCSVPLKTSKLEKIVDVALKLYDLEIKCDKNLRKDFRLFLPGRLTDYSKAFLMISSLQKIYATPYIVCGIAKINKVNDGFLAEYITKIFNYEPDKPDLTAYTFFSESDCRPMLKKTLNSLAKSGQTCSVYSFSAHILKESNCPIGDKRFCVEIRPNFSDAVVIRNRCVKRLENRTR